MLSHRLPSTIYSLNRVGVFQHGAYVEISRIAFLSVHGRVTADFTADFDV
jgi:hypothetical protein